MRLALPAVASTSDGAPSSRREPRWWTGWAWGRADSRAAAAPPSPPPPATPEPTSPLPPAALPAAHPIESQPPVPTMHHAAAPTDPLTLLEWHGEQCRSRGGLPYRRSCCATREALLALVFLHSLPCLAESPVPLRLTVARATLCPTVGFLKMWGSPEDKAQLSARADLQLLPCRLSLDLTCKVGRNIFGDVHASNLPCLLPACHACHTQYCGALDDGLTQAGPPDSSTGSYRCFQHPPPDSTPQMPSCRRLCWVAACLPHCPLAGWSTGDASACPTAWCWRWGRGRSTRGAAMAAAAAAAATAAAAAGGGGTGSGPSLAASCSWPLGEQTAVSLREAAAPLMFGRQLCAPVCARLGERRAVSLAGRC